MLRTSLLVLAAASMVVASPAAPFADSVVSYHPGVGYASRFTYANSVLGEPSRVNPFAEPTDPFNPAYGTNQVLSIGAGGWLIVEFHTPVLNHPNNRFGLDFIVFANSGFIITNEFDPMNYNWIGIPATDGSLFGYNTGDTLVSVSRNGVDFYALEPLRAPVVDVLFPTDGTGDFQIPMDPLVTQQDFAGLTLEEIHALYHGSGGGAAFDISWARDGQGNAVFLPEINFVRIDVLNGKAEVDAFAAVVRHPRLPR